MAIADDDIERIRSTVSIVDIVGQHVQLKRTGRNWVGLVPVPRRADAVVQRARGDGPVPLFRLRQVGRRVHLRAGDRAHRLRRLGRVPRQSSRHPAHRDVAGSDPGARSPQAAGRGDERGGRVVPPAAPHVARRPRRPGLPPRAGVCRATSPDSSSSAGRPTTGTRCSRSRASTPSCCSDNGLAFTNRRNQMQDAFRARVLFPIFTENGDAVALGGRILPGSDDPAKYKNSSETPIYTKSKTLYGLNWAKGDIVNANQVIVCEGYTDVIGFHRAGSAASGRDLRHGVHRGARPAAQAVRESRRAGLRRRRRRPGRRRTLLRVGGEVPGRGQRRRVPRRQGSRRAGPERSGGSRKAAVDGASRSWGSGSDRVLSTARHRSRPRRSHAAR